MAFQAGPATGNARFYLHGTVPEVEVTLRNDTSGPIWWRGAGIGCVGSHWLVDPVTTEGVVLQGIGDEGIGCTMEEDKVPAEADLARWRLDPGDEEAWLAHPFRRSWGNDHVPDTIGSLEKWAWCHEITLPRATSPPGTMQFDQPCLTLAWSRITGPRVFLDQDYDVHLDHFDPFAERPYWRGDTRLPLQFGPLRGEVSMHEENGYPVVDWTLSNPLDSEVAWSLLPTDGALEWGFTEIEWQEGMDADAWLYEPEIRHARGAFPIEEGGRFAPGQSRSGSISPFTFEPTREVWWDEEPGPKGLRRWHFILSSSWPCYATPGVRPSCLPARLHIYWDMGLGLDMSLQPPESFLKGTRWKPYSAAEKHLADTASMLLGGCDAYATLRLWNGNMELFLMNRSVTPIYWVRHAYEESPAAWTLFAGQPRRTLPPLPMPAGEAGPLNDNWLRSLRIVSGGSGHYNLRLDEELQRSGENAERSAFSRSWEMYKAVALPRTAPPAHRADAEPAILRLRWTEGAGLDAEVVADWPR